MESTIEKILREAEDGVLDFTWPETEQPCDGICQAVNPPQESTGPTRLPSNVESWSSHYSVRESALRGCYKCLLVYHSLSDHDEIMLLTLAPGSAGIVFIVKGLPTNIQLVYKVGSSPPPWHYVCVTRVSQLDSRRAEYAPILQSWLDSCNLTHRKCSAASTRLPTRVLDVFDSNNIFLRVCSAGDVGQYVALSHCWGDTAMIQTTTLNIRDMEQRVDHNDLPKSFQDAVAVTRAIGLRYLWIDSLCILQDSTEDWQTQSSRMAEIYNSAYLVLAASRAKDSTVGFLDRDPITHEDRLPWQVLGRKSLNQRSLTKIARIQNPRDQDVSCVYVKQLWDNHCTRRHHSALGQSPLAGRAWALQENLLARRIVHFTKDEMMWECVECLKCECMEVDNTTDGMETSGGLFRRAQLTMPKGLEISPYDKFHFWRCLLARYSALKLTRESDRLPALSGLIKSWQALGHGKNLAGFWEKDIVESLVWTVITRFECKRAADYRAPSWSPFSLDSVDGVGSKGGVEFEYPLYKHRITTRLAVVVDAHCEPAGLDDTGAVKSGYLILRGKVLRCPVITAGFNTPAAYKHSADMRLCWDLSVNPLVFPTLTVLFLGHNRVSETGGYHISYALLLLPSKEVSGAFERVGMAVSWLGLGDEMGKLFPENEEELKIV
ncbi:heterokaryon incompatibility protein-domain-containing protein [Echria macrotheca]|uniref:Heterokaryon incompatibility protein-domain-containing protein n=1 Tax=Echria macrotheca TaxID=438768 RepID=A0AAJ0F3Z5_9PEZI|nr:heterokaryon incompatibility protein-domain-containing protein [Echria macrotheca]